MSVDTAETQAHNDPGKEEAASSSFWVSGWRPGVGWVCVAALAMVYIPKAVVLTFIWTYQCVVLLNAWHGGALPVLPVYPDLGITDLIGLLMPMLGIGGLRTIEKLNSKA